MAQIGLDGLVKPAIPQMAQLYRDGETRDLHFSDFGITITQNRAFDATNDLNTNNTFGITQSDRKTEMTYQIGSGGKVDEDRMKINLGQINVNSLNPELSRIQSFNTAKDAEKAIGHVTRAIDKLQASRANIGTTQNRLQFTQRNLLNSIENNGSAHSTLINLDMASEMTRFTTKRILEHSGISMLSHANRIPRNLLTRLML